VLLVTFLIALIAARVGIQRAIRGADLALDKRWHASSKAFDCHPKTNECGGAQTNIFFHTQEEDSPWVEYDLGAPQKLARVHVTNRDDCCGERATPLLVEVSDDDKTWRGVAKQTETFRDVDIKFTPVTARYLRLRVEKRTAMHLGGVSIHAR
jgi:hypothetical protein